MMDNGHVHNANGKNPSLLRQIVPKNCSSKANGSHVYLYLVSLENWTCLSGQHRCQLMKSVSNSGQPSGIPHLR